MKKRGFTLIELLAVIVILAVIALIAIPMILNVVEDSRMSAFKDSVYSAFDAVEYYLIDEDLGDVPESGIEVKFLNLKNNNFESGRMVKNVDGVLVAEFVSDGKYCATGSLTNLNISKGECEINAPGVESVVTGKEIAIIITDDNGIVAYAITTSSEEPSEWTEVTETTRIEENKTAEAAGTYYVHVRNKYGKTTTKEYVVEQNAFCAYEEGYVWTYNYSADGMQTFQVPCDGTYKLEVYGGRGGGASYRYGDGCAWSYSTVDMVANGNASGNFNFTKDKELYIYVGGTGGGGLHLESECSWAGSSYSGSAGYNGGIVGTGNSSGSGGATHIAVATGNYSSTLLNSGNILVSAKGGNGIWKGWGTYYTVKVNGGGTNYVNTNSEYYLDSSSTTASDTTTASTAKITLLSINK